MIFIPYTISILESLVVVLPALLSVAYVTIVERNTMASMQRRLGPNIVGYYGLLQAFADALKLLLKEYVSPTQANMIVFFLGPIITLVFSLLSLAVIPFAPGLSLSDFSLAILFLLAVSSLSTYGILLAGWSANSKYAFLGSLRSTAQLISYELVLSSIILIIVLLTSSLNLTVMVECQKAAWFILPLLPVFIIFFIAAVAETNRAPFDLAEAESELVSGFMTEHSSVIFVFFFLAEYASMVVICILITLLFLGGYNLDLTFTVNLSELIMNIASFIYNLIVYLIYFLISIMQWMFNFNNNIYFGGFMRFFYDQNVHFSTIFDYKNFDQNNFFSSLIIAIKSFVMIFTFIWVRASFPRVRFDQLMTYCWIILLPLVFGLLILIPCILYVLDMMPSNTIYF